MDNENRYKNKEPEKIKEDFCGACLAVPLALAGAGASISGVNRKGSYRKSKRILLWGGIISIIASIAIAYYFLKIKKCSECV